jgi:hypothetical protein
MGDYYCKIQEARKIYPRAYLHWKPEEDTRLREEVRSGLKVVQISKLHQRQPGAIQGRLEHLGLG